MNHNHAEPIRTLTSLSKAVFLVVVSGFGLSSYVALSQVSEIIPAVKSIDALAKSATTSLAQGAVVLSGLCVVALVIFAMIAYRMAAELIQYLINQTKEMSNLNSQLQELKSIMSEHSTDERLLRLERRLPIAGSNEKRSGS